MHRITLRYDPDHRKSKNGSPSIIKERAQWPK
jgi:hypothetical protein